MAHLWPLVATPGGNWSIGQPHWSANKFHVTTTGQQVTQLGYYVGGTGANGPDQISLVNPATGASLATTTPSYPTSAGWHYVDVQAVDLVQNQVYAVVQHVPANTTYYFTNGGPVPEAPIVLDSHWWDYNNIPTGAMGGNQDSSYATCSVTVAAAPTGGGGGGSFTITDVDNDIKTWLSATPETNQHHTDLPWTTKAGVDTLNGSVGTPSDTGNTSLWGKYNQLAQGLGADANGYYANLKGLITTIKSVTDTLPTPIARLSAIVLDHYTADINSILSTLNSVLSGVNSNAGVGTFAVDVLAGRSGFPSGTPNHAWTMTAQTDFDTSLAWAEPADLYVAHISSVPAGVGTTDFAGLTFHHRLGSWCVLNGSLGSTRRFLEFQDQVLDDGGRRMPGLALKCKQGTIGTVQAWQLAP